MKVQYLIRLDDACPMMDRERWNRMENILDKYHVKPLVGIIPANHDKGTMIDSYDSDFWNKTQQWVSKGWQIALHGFDHICITHCGGTNPIWNRSEFAGLEKEKQRTKIKEGLAILNVHQLYPKYFFAPSHTFDENTIAVLREETDIRIVSDTIGRWPYKKEDFWFIPQISGHCIKMPLAGIYTFCFHPNIMNETAFQHLEAFLSKYALQFIGFDEIDLSKYGKKKYFDKILSSIYFTYRKIKK